MNKGSAKAFLIGNACMLLATIFWGINVPFTKALIPDWMSAHGIAVVRLAGGALLFWITSLFIKCEAIRKEDWRNVVLGGVVGLFLFIYLFITSLRFGSAIDIAIIMTMPPMFVILIGVLFEHQRPSALEYLGVAVSFAGAVIVVLAGAGAGRSAPEPILGDILAMLSCLCYAFYLVIMERPSKAYSPTSLLRWVFLFAALPSIALMPGMCQMPILTSTNPVPWLEIAFILFCPTFISYFLVQPAIKDIGSELSSLYQYLLPVVAALAAVLMGMEEIEISQCVAMIVIVAGMVLTNVGKKKRVAAAKGAGA